MRIVANGLCCSIGDIWSFQGSGNSLNYSQDTCSSVKIGVKNSTFQPEYMLK